MDYPEIKEFSVEKLSITVKDEFCDESSDNLICQERNRSDWGIL